MLARHLKVVIDHTLWIDLDALSDSPDGNGTGNGPARRQRVGTIRTPKGSVPILLEREQNDDGIRVWKISAATVANIADLYALFGYGRIGEWLPEPFFEITFLQIELWQWIALGIWGLLATLASWLVSALIARLVCPLVARLRKTAGDKAEPLIVGPLRLSSGILLFISGSFALGLALPVQAFFDGAGKALVVAALTWLLLRLIDILFLKVEDHLMARGQGAAVAMLPLGRRTAKVFLIAVAALAFLQNVGFNVSGLLAGLGVGGLAVALAAQETVKNFFGGVTLIADQPVRVGDLCRFGDKTGTVEDISLWSTRVRTPDRTVISIPNAQFASMQLENFARRDRIRLATAIGLHTDTTAEQVRRVLAELTTLLREHPKIDASTARAQLCGFGNAAFRMEISAYVLTADFQEYATIREDLFLRIMDIVGGSGSKFGTLG
jgi:MscS family membrane protein